MGVIKELYLGYYTGATMLIGGHHTDYFLPIMDYGILIQVPQQQPRSGDVAEARGLQPFMSRALLLRSPAAELNFWGSLHLTLCPRPLALVIGPPPSNSLYSGSY